MENGKKKRKKKGKKLMLLLLLLLAAGAVGIGAYKKKEGKKTAAEGKTASTATVSRMDVSAELTASSSLSPKATYEVTSLVEGEVLEALFEEGDVVEKGQVLYRIDASSMDTELSSAQTSLLRAKESLASAKEEYESESSKLSGNTYKAKTSGYIKTLYIKEGDKVGNGTKLADLYDDSVMKLTVPFLSGEAAQIPVGSAASITLEDTGEVISGTVTVVSSMEETLSGGRLVKAVTVEVPNPGGLTTLTRASVSAGGFQGSSEGTFVPKTELTLTAEFSGNKNLEVGTLLTVEGAYVEKGTALFKASEKSASDYLKDFADAVESAGDTVENSENKLANTQDNLEEYTITAPISGTVITKSAKVGDKIAKNSGSAAVLAVLYDLSSMTLEMSVDEMDVASVKTGQDVEITADAVSGETFTGTVTNVSLESTVSNGVTNYPVTVTLKETGSLLPGMNVDAKIILESARDALVIPAGALQRGNKVYVKGTDQESRAEGSGNVPEGFTAVQVETGITNDDYVQILSGLSEGDEVYVSEDSQNSSQIMMQMGAPMGGPGGMPGGGPDGGGRRGQ